MDQAFFGARSEAWRTTASVRCRQALTAATALGDRLALLRSLTRLQDGRTALGDECLILSNEEVSALSRFGLALTSNGSAVRLIDEVADWMPDGFSAAVRLDSSKRASFASASPDAVLLRHSPHSAYQNAAQKSAARALLTMPDGAGLMVSMFTGGGKSLLFQLYPIFCRSQTPGACVAVITPTVALALDHVRTLSTIPGLEQSRALTGGIKGIERENLLNSFRRGEIPVLFMSPEFALGPARAALIETAKAADAKYSGLDGRLKALFVDEAHIIESWGRSFRPDFQRLPALLEELRREDPTLRAILLSATLPPAAKTELRRAYGSSGDWLEIDAQTPRYEFDIVIKSFSEAEERQDCLYRMIDYAPRPLIVYTTRVDDANTVYDQLKSRSYERLSLFTGDIVDTSARLQIVNDWAANRIDVVVATSAFGMGVDKADVRTVIHACLPEGPARWYQEIGRAARDGHQGLAVCLFTREGHRNDVNEAYRQATGSWLTRELAEPRWRALLERCVISTWNGANQRLRLDLDAAREGLSTRTENDYNRNWNRSLLNLLQRAGVIEIISVSSAHDAPGSAWEIELKEPRILDPNNKVVWDDVFRIRDAEQTTSRTELDSFKEIMMRPRSQCCVRSVFNLIQGNSEKYVPPCGRCHWCRGVGEPPPYDIKVYGMETAWPKQTNSHARALPPGFTLITPQDADYEAGLSALLHRLTDVGFEQFLVPHSISKVSARILFESSARVGLLLAHDEWDGPPQTSLAMLSTAALFPRDEVEASHLLHRLRQFSTASPGLSIAVVARPDRLVDERRLDQTVSNYAPYMEEFLETLALENRTTS